MDVPESKEAEQGGASSKVEENAVPTSKDNAEPTLEETAEARVAAEAEREEKEHKGWEKAAEEHPTEMQTEKQMEALKGIQEEYESRLKNQEFMSLLNDLYDNKDGFGKIMRENWGVIDDTLHKLTGETVSDQPPRTTADLHKQIDDMEKKVQEIKNELAADLEVLDESERSFKAVEPVVTGIERIVRAIDLINKAEKAKEACEKEISKATTSVTANVEEKVAELSRPGVFTSENK